MFAGKARYIGNSKSMELLNCEKIKEQREKKLKG